MQKFIFSGKCNTGPPGRSPDRGTLHTFCHSPIPSTPQKGVFLERLAPALLIKKNGTREFKVCAQE